VFGHILALVWAGQLFAIVLIASLAVAVWRFARPPAVFVVRIRDGRPKATYGKVTDAFLSEVAELCRDLDVAAGEIRGVARGRNLGLWFSRELPGSYRQRLRNWWALSGWRCGTGRV
jgi:hypothetical protein